MTYYIGLDVAVKYTAICIVDGEGRVVRERALVTEPESLAAYLRGTGLAFERVGLEAGPLSSWLYEGLKAAGLPVICVESRHMKSALAAMRNKTDRQDARGIAQMMRLGWFRAVHVKGREAQELRFLLVSRRLLLGKRLDIENGLRGMLKVFGVKLGVVGRAGFEERVVTLLANHPGVLDMVRPILEVRRVLLEQGAVLHRRLVGVACQDEVCRRLMTVPGVGPLTAVTFRSGVDAPKRFARSRSVGAHFGLTPRTHASGESERSGRISKCGDRLVRTSLYEAANTLLTRLKKECALKDWGLRVAKRAGLFKARVAVARRLAVILHRMWLDGSDFRWGAVEEGTA